MGEPSAELLPATLPGTPQPEPYPPHGDLAAARVLWQEAGPPPRHTITLATEARDAAVARELVRQLRPLGLRVRLLPPPLGGGPLPSADLQLLRARPVVHDPMAVLDPLLGPATMNHNLTRRLRRTQRQSGEVRGEAFARLAVRLAREAAPVAVLWRANFSVAASSGLMGTAPHPVYAIDLAALAHPS